MLVCSWLVAHSFSCSSLAFSVVSSKTAKCGHLPTMRSLAQSLILDGQCVRFLTCPLCLVSRSQDLGEICLTIWEEISLSWQIWACSCWLLSSLLSSQEPRSNINYCALSPLDAALLARSFSFITSAKSRLQLPAESLRKNTSICIPSSQRWAHLKPMKEASWLADPMMLRLKKKQPP